MTAGALGTRILGAAHRVVAIPRRTARAASRRGLVGRGAAIQLVRAQSRVLTLARSADVLGARVFVVAIGVFAALCAAGAGTAHAVVRAGRSSVVAQPRRADVVRADVLVLTAGRVGTGFLLAAVVGRRAILVRLAVAVVH